MTRQPYMPLWTADWQSEPTLRLVSPAAELVWFRLTMLMWDSPERGRLLLPSGVPPTNAEIARLIGRDEALVADAVAELERASVFTREGGVIVCRRQVRDAKRSESARKSVSHRWSKDEPEDRPEGERNTNRTAERNTNRNSISRYGSGSLDLDSGSSSEEQKTGPEAEETARAPAGEDLGPLLQASLDLARGSSGPVVLEQRKPRVEASDVDAVLDRYREHHPKARPGEKERKLVRARLGEGYSVEELRRAIDGNTASPFHSGENDRGTAYQRVSLIFKDSDHVANFLALADQHCDAEGRRRAAPVMTERTRRNIRAVEAWLEEDDLFDIGGGKRAES